MDDGTYGEVGVYGPFCDDGEACDAACAMILLALLRSLKDLCFLLLVDLPALYPKLSRCDRLLLEENMAAHMGLMIVPPEEQDKGASHPTTEGVGGGDI
jgi:hypothetical protein